MSDEPPPKKPTKPAAPRRVSDDAENARRAEAHAAAMAEWELLMAAHREVMAERKRNQDKASRPTDDGARAVKRRQGSASSSSAHAAREATRSTATKVEERRRAQTRQILDYVPCELALHLRSIVALESLPEPQTPFPPAAPPAPPFGYHVYGRLATAKGQQWEAECKRRGFPDFESREQAWIRYAAQCRHLQRAKRLTRAEVAHLIGESIHAEQIAADGSAEWEEDNQEAATKFEEAYLTDLTWAREDSVAWLQSFDEAEWSEFLAKPPEKPLAPTWRSAAFREALSEDCRHIDPFFGLDGLEEVRAQFGARQILEWLATLANPAKADEVM